MAAGCGRLPAFAAVRIIALEYAEPGRKRGKQQLISVFAHQFWLFAHDAGPTEAMLITQPE